MSRDLDAALFGAKDHLTRCLCDMVRVDAENGGKLSEVIHQLTRALDAYQKAHNAREDSICAHRDECEIQILRLVHDLAKRKET
jgi:hypothetical protein